MLVILLLVLRFMNSLEIRLEKECCTAACAAPGLRAIGKGYTAAQVLCGIMNLHPPPSKFTMYEHVLGEISQNLCKLSMENAVNEAVEVNEGIRDLCRSGWVMAEERSCESEWNCVCDLS